MRRGLSSTKRVVLGVVGCLATALGIIGVWVPGLPTTIFIIIALWAFTRSSERLYQKLWRIKILQPALHMAERFQQEKIIDWRIKCIALSFAWGSLVLVAIVAPNPVALALTLVCALVCTAVMIKYPSRKTGEQID